MNGKRPDRKLESSSEAPTDATCANRLVRLERTVSEPILTSKNQSGTRRPFSIVEVMVSSGLPQSVTLKPPRFPPNKNWPSNAKAGVKMKISLTELTCCRSARVIRPLPSLLSGSSATMLAAALIEISAFSIVALAKSPALIAACRPTTSIATPASNRFRRKNNSESPGTGRGTLPTGVLPLRVATATPTSTSSASTNRVSAVPSTLKKSSPIAKLKSVEDWLSMLVINCRPSVTSLPAVLKIGRIANCGPVSGSPKTLSSTASSMFRPAMNAAVALPKSVSASYKAPAADPMNVAPSSAAPNSLLPFRFSLVSPATLNPLQSPKDRFRPEKFQFRLTSGSSGSLKPLNDTPRKSPNWKVSLSASAGVQPLRSIPEKSAQPNLSLGGSVNAVHAVLMPVRKCSIPAPSESFTPVKSLSLFVKFQISPDANVNPEKSTSRKMPLSVPLGRVTPFQIEPLQSMKPNSVSVKFAPVRFAQRRSKLPSLIPVKSTPDKSQPLQSSERPDKSSEEFQVLAVPVVAVGRDPNPILESIPEISASTPVTPDQSTS